MKEVKQVVVQYLTVHRRRVLSPILTNDESTKIDVLAVIDLCVHTSFLSCNQAWILHDCVVTEDFS